LATYKNNVLKNIALLVVLARSEDGENGPVLPVKQAISCSCSGICWGRNFDTSTVLHRKELEMGKLLGEGAFSQVFAVTGLELDDDKVLSRLDKGASLSPTQKDARQQLVFTADLHHPLAVKCLRRNLLQRPEKFHQAVLDMEREAHLLSALSHPHIIPLRAVSVGGAQSLQSGNYKDFFLVLDRIQDTLDGRIMTWKNIGPPAMSTLITYAQQLASALVYLHEQRIIFRDCKPENVGFVSNNGEEERIQLFDFGLCRLLPTSSSSSSSCYEETFHMSMAGTSRYMAPECHSHSHHKAACNCKADVYSWALTVYEMMTQLKPYDHIQNINYFYELVHTMQVRPSLMSLQKGDSCCPAEIPQILEQAWCHSVYERLTMPEVLGQLEAVQHKLIVLQQ